MRYAFKINSLLMVEAESEEEAWNSVSETAQHSVSDFEYERSSENDVSEKFIYVILKVGYYRADVLEHVYTSKEEADKDAERMKLESSTRHSFEVKRLTQKG